MIRSRRTSLYNADSKQSDFFIENFGNLQPTPKIKKMKFEFDANQDYQRNAIDAVVKLFEGQIPIRTTLQFSGESNFIAIPNRLDLDSKQIGINLKAIQETNGIDGNSFSTKGFPNFSVEMETGTGKTYIYLRTALELFQQYGMRKFIVVVPSVAIREGVLKTLQITESHFRELYNNLPYRYYVYDSMKLSQVRQFALSDSVEIMVMTLASFNKASNVIRQSTERLQGEKPINLIKAACPILILDEPQRMESDLSIESLSSLSPVFALRYSATHRNLYNCIYRLTPYDAYREGLVKQIEVAGVEESTNTNLAFVQVKSIQSQKTRVTAKLAVHKLQKNGTVKQTTLSVKRGDDLGTPNKTNLPEYAGYQVNEIDMSWGYVRFDNGVEVKTGESHGADKSAVFEAQIRYTIEEHFRKQARLKEHNIKVLSLFFIDKVDNYAGENGIIRQLFDKWFNTLKQQDRYSEWREKQPEDVQAAYFAQSRRRTGEIVYEDSKTGEAQKDSEAYQLIMKDKERLLSFDEPTCFIFSHSALREGWDSPNVFQICTLNQTASEMKKRQEIGRGVRLAVDQTGKRVHDGKLNVLTVIANESYRNYVNQLQTEVLEEFGNATSAPKPKNARERDVATLKKAMMLTPEFEILWERIKHKTKYKVNIDTEKLIIEVVEVLDETDIRLPKIIIERGRLVVDEEKNEFGDQHIGEGSFEYRLAGGVNVLKLIEHRLAYTTPAMKLTRRTLLEILKRTRNQQAALDNPPEFAKIVVEKIRQKIITQLIDGIKYEKIGEAYEMRQFDCELESWKDCMVPAAKTKKSVYEGVIYDSDVEKQFVEGLERRDDIILYVKLPAFFTVPTPIGNYNPDWAIVKEERDAHGESIGEEKLYLVTETKSTTDSGELRLREERKISCGTRHFRDALRVDYKVVTSAEEV